MEAIQISKEDKLKEDTLKSIEEGIINFYIVRNGIKEKVRLFKSSYSDLCQFRKGSNRRGYKIDNYELSKIDDIIPIIQNINPEEKWRKSILKAIGFLEKSGLWSDMLPDLKDALSIGYDKLQLAYAESWKNYEGLSYEDTHKRREEEVKKIDERLIKDNSLRTSILWYMVNPLKIKKMFFGKYQNEEKLKEIEEAIKNNKKIKIDGRSSYDVSFEYNPDQKKAWYSEEYKNCGNGHYYLALNGTHALFYEDD